MKIDRLAPGDLIEHALALVAVDIVQHARTHIATLKLRDEARARMRASGSEVVSLRLDAQVEETLFQLRRAIIYLEVLCDR